MEKKKLTQLEYAVTQHGETEPPFSHPGFPSEPGDFICVCCKNKLFTSSTKFESGSGWPSFSSPATRGHRNRDRYVIRDEKGGSTLQ